MVYISCITLLLLSTVVLADYDMDNANASIIYSMPPSQSDQSWKPFTADSVYQELEFNNSTGNYTILLDASNCYDQNYAQGICSTGDNCFIQIPFAGSGITMYVFNAGVTGMTASFSVDGRAAVSNSTAPPTAAENYQVSNFSLYDVQGLPSGNHTIKMTLMDWDGSGTVMKFDYAHVNESFVAIPSSTTASSSPTTASTARSSSQAPTQTSAQTLSASESNRIDAGGIAGITLGVSAMLGGIVTGILWFRKCRASHRGSSNSAPESTFQIDQFISEYLSSITPSSPSRTQQSNEHSDVPPLMRSAILRDAHAAGKSPPSIPIQSRPIASGATAAVLQQLRRHSAVNDSSMFHVADEGLSALSDPAISFQRNLTPIQVETVRGLLAERVHVDTIACVIEALVSSRVSAAEADTGHVTHSSESACSLELPPSYQTRDRR